MKRSLPLLIFFIYACFSGPQPDWTISQPQVSGYWSGIGIVEKPFSGSNIREEARNKALAEISAQISVEISSSFENIVTEQNMDLETFSRSVIKTRSETDLPEIEIVDSYESKTAYYLLTRLSQKSYYKSVERKRRNAVKTALGLLESAEVEFSVAAFAQLGAAFREILPYVDVPIREEYPRSSGKTINLYSYLRLKIVDYLGRLSLEAVEMELDVKLGFTRNVEVTIKAFDGKSGDAIANVPVQLYIMEKGKGITSHSDENGLCSFSLPQLEKQSAIQQLSIQVVEEELFGAISGIPALVLPETHVTLRLKQPLIYLNITENNLGEAVENPYITPVIMEYLAREFSAGFVELGTADLVIAGNVNTRQVRDKPNEWGIYQVFGDLTLTIYNGQTGQEFLSKSLNKVQGSDFGSNKEAGVQALKKMTEEIFEDFLPELVKILRE